MLAVIRRSRSYKLLHEGKPRSFNALAARDIRVANALRHGSLTLEDIEAARRYVAPDSDRFIAQQLRLDLLRLVALKAADRTQPRTRLSLRRLLPRWEAKPQLPARGAASTLRPQRPDRGAI